MKTKLSFATVAIALIVALTAQTAVAQLFGKKAEKPSPEFVTKSAFMYFTLYHKDITSMEALKLFPREIVTAWGKKEFGFDPMLIKQATFMMKAPESLDDQGPPAYAAIFHFEEMQGLSGGMIDELEKKKVAGKSVFSSGNPYEPSYMVIDESTMVVGDERYFEEMLVSPPGRVATLMKEGTATGQAFAYFDIKGAEPFLDEVLSQMSENYVVPPEVERMKLIPSLLNSVESAVETKSKFEGKVILHARDAKDAEELNEIIVDSMEYYRKLLLTKMAQEMDMEDPVQVATVQYTKRIYEKFEKQLTPEVKGKDLTITVQEEILALPFLAGLMGRAAYEATELEVRMTPELRLRQTALAFHNYESAYRKFPNRVIKDENGKELFSGRVAILPFIEQNNLYQKLRLDEAWDSRHNRQFTEMAVPQFGMTVEGKSTIRFPVFPDSLWDDKNADSGFANITDGTSNTIFAIEAPPEDATSWADPTPWTISPSNPMRDVFGDRDEVVVAMMDGSTRKLKKADMTNEKLKAMLTISGGEVVR